MIRKMLYRTQREGGGYTVSLARPPEGVHYKVRWRLIAEEGMAITDGERVVSVIDVQTRAERDKWRDCEKPAEPDPADEATADFVDQPALAEAQEDIIPELVFIPGA